MNIFSRVEFKILKMKQSLILLGFLLFLSSCAQKKNSSELKLVLIDQLKYSHAEENWFAPTKIAISGLTAEQSNWKDSTDNHSIAELVSHLTFWNEAFLKDINGEEYSDYDMENKLTFKIYSEKEWKRAVTKMDSIQTAFEKIIDKANEEQLSELAADILTMTSHNAYHTGQIIYIRKRKGWWNKN